MRKSLNQSGILPKINCYTRGKKKESEVHAQGVDRVVYGQMPVRAKQDLLIST